MKYLGIFVFFCFFQTCLSAQQAPGLMGKRLSFFANINLLNNFNSPRFNALNKVEAKDYKFHHYLFTYSFRYELEAEYNLSRNQSVGLSYGFLNTGVPSSDNLHSLNLFAHQYALHFKYYDTGRTGSIAPVGTYLQAKVIGINSSVVRKPIPSLSADPEKILNHFNPAISIGYGRQTILFKTVLFNFGIDLGFVVPFQNKNPLEKEVYKRLLKHNLLKFRLGIGIPIFPLDQKKVSLSRPVY